MYYKNFFTRFFLRKNLLKRIRMRLGNEVRKFSKNEFNDLSFLYKLIGESPKVIFDCGANVGFVSYQFHKHFPTAAIHSFEPNPDVFNVLKRNLEKEKSNILPIHAGIGSEEGTLTFFKNNNTGTSSFLQPNDFHLAHMARRYTQISIPVVTIQSFCQENGIDAIGILKLDIEGFELKALEGCRKLLESQQIDFLFIEVSLVPSYRGQPLMEDVMAYVRVLGYVPYNFYGINETIFRECLITNLLFMSRRVAQKINTINGTHAVYVP